MIRPGELQLKCGIQPLREGWRLFSRKVLALAHLDAMRGNLALKICHIRLNP
jgi:hypothetical protein